jgi:hypothetical protein
MPRIFLKPNSAEFADPKRARSAERHCDMPSCREKAEHRAPKDRALSDYYHFCLEHVREYNAAWDFFSGMAPHEVEQHMFNSIYGDRPTRRFDMAGMAEALRRKAWQTYHHTTEEPPKHNHFGGNRNTPEFEALGIMGLEAPITLKTIKTRYKELAKKHHPDLNGGDAKSEELLKRINMAYTILKVAYENFEKLPERT